MTDFSNSAAELEGVVRQACATEDEWPARVAAGIQATVDFVTEHPKSAQALAVDLRVDGLDVKYLPVIEKFSRMLATETPQPESPTPSIEKALVGGIASVISTHVRTERFKQLQEQAPDLIYFVLLPYLGYEDAKQWVQAAPASSN